MRLDSECDGRYVTPTNSARTAAMPEDSSAHHLRWRQWLQNFRRSFDQLQRAVTLSEQRKLSELEQQGLIQAFEIGTQDDSSQIQPITPGFPRTAETEFTSPYRIISKVNTSISMLGDLHALYE